MDRSARLLRTSNREKSDTNKDPYTRQRNSHHPELDIVEKICYQSHPLRSPPHPNTTPQVRVTQVTPQETQLVLLLQIANPAKRDQIISEVQKKFYELLSKRN